MGKKFIVIFLLLMFMALFGCAAKPCKVMTIFNHCPLERPYLVYGKVVNLQNNPVEDCKVFLIKRKYPLKAGQPVELKGEYLVARTDQLGEYSFCFEPLGANDVWLFFDAGNKGYPPQFIELNHLMGETFMQKPGNSPLVVDMILEKTL